MVHVHFVGIGGTGLSAIARVLLESGYSVSGSDRQYTPLAKAVEAAGARFYLGHQPEHVNGADIVVRSSAVPDENIEVRTALSKGIPVYKRAGFLGQLIGDKKGIAVAGTHGKTTTTAMIAWILSELGQDPSFIVGGSISGLETNARSGSGPAFVIEADEYDHMFLGLRPYIAVITNIEHDHPDCYPSARDYQEAFLDFVDRLVSEGILLACGDRPDTREVLALAKKNGNRTLTYGIENPENNYQAKNLKANPHTGGFDFQIWIGSSVAEPVSLQVPGRHNVENASAALAVAEQLGLSMQKAAKALASFRGTDRRFEIMGEINGITVVSDYAHHPTEILATLSGARSRYPESRLWAVWQPHTYSRTKLLFDAFTKSFGQANEVLVTEVYPAREPVNGEFSARQIVGAMDHPHAMFMPEISAAVEYLSTHLVDGDVLIVLSAGDADQICHQVLESLVSGGLGGNDG